MLASRLASRLRAWSAAALLAMVAVPLAAAAQSLPPLGEHIQMSLDDARAFSLPDGAKMVVLGNPSVVDATTTPVPGTTFTVLTAKAYGTTTLQVLDDKGRQIALSLVSVGRENRDTVTVHLGRKDRMSFNCTPVCAAAPTLGDGAESFATAASQAQLRASRATERR